MIITYKQAKELKDAGFPQKGTGYFQASSGGSKMYSFGLVYTGGLDTTEEVIYYPFDLGELIEACGDVILYKHPKINTWNETLNNMWVAGKPYLNSDNNYLCASTNFVDFNIDVSGIGLTPGEALTMLWLRLNNK